MLKYLAATALLLAVPTVSYAQETTFKCPVAGTRVERTDAPALGYRGASADALQCLDQNGRPRFLGYWRTSDLFYRTGGQALAREFANAATGQSRPVSIEYFGVGRSMDSTWVRETWQALGRERVTIMAGTFDATKVQRSVEIVGSTFRYTETVWFDTASGVPVRSSVEHRNAFMSPDVLNWQATDIVTRHDGHS